MKEKNPRDYINSLLRIQRAGLSPLVPPNRTQILLDDLSSVEDRISRVLGLINQHEKKSNNMLFFVMYDIESDKVRRYVVKYLLKQGCIRVQRSIFLANLNASALEEIKQDLAEVQAVYDNEDSVLIVPISTDYLKAMKVIGKNINLDIITRSKNTLFF